MVAKKVLVIWRKLVKKIQTSTKATYNIFFFPLIFTQKAKLSMVVFLLRFTALKTREICHNSIVTYAIDVFDSSNVVPFCLRTRVHKLDNVNSALKMIKKAEVPTTNLKQVSMLDGEFKAMCGTRVT